MPKHPTSSGFAPHDHARCRTASLEVAQSAGPKLSGLRQQVLMYLIEEHRALGAYDIVARAKADGGKVQATQVYRALEYLEAAGVVHRIEAVNAYVACADPGNRHDAVFLICRDCKRVSETPMEDPPRRVADAAALSNFELESATVEAMGVCPDCKSSETRPDDQ